MVSLGGTRLVLRSLVGTSVDERAAPAVGSGTRRLPVGAELDADGGVSFRVWAPATARVEIVLEGGAGAGSTGTLVAQEHGYHALTLREARAGTRYRFRLEGHDRLVPDPVSRFQPDGPHGSSEVIDPTRFAWTDGDWPGVSLAGQVIYEMHIGTFTAAGTWAMAAAQLPEVARLGVTVLEVMPVADFPGRFGWGYDGVCFFAPTRLYGRPDDFRGFVDRAHGLGLAVILDVVYNHAGPDGNYLEVFAPEYFTDRYATDWGKAINFDGPDAGPVREFFTSNAGYWIDEYHLDGLRLDATQSIFDSSRAHILLEVTRRVRAAARGRRTLVVAENEPQEAHLVRPASQGGYEIDAVWNDDFHHSAMVALTGRREAYYGDHGGTPQELLSAVKWGYLFQGQRYRWQEQNRGTPALDLPPARFVLFIQNHDQVANSVRGERVHALTSRGRLRALTALMLLAPGTPMLFQGQEFCASSPFLYFADHGERLGTCVRAGRAEFLRQFPSIASSEASESLADPAALATFERSKLAFAERDRAGHREVWVLHQDLLAIRRKDPTFRGQRPRGHDGAVLGAAAFALRIFGEGGDDRLLLVNLGPDLELSIAPEPLLAPPTGRRWSLMWSSETTRYGGGGAASLGAVWCLPGEATLVLHPEPCS
jgi:maltooligosyltrehalose trehalohydrolase